MRKERVRVPEAGVHTVVYHDDWTISRIQRLNSGESMGLPGWHDMDAAIRLSYLADTEEEAIKVLESRRR